MAYRWSADNTVEGSYMSEKVKNCGTCWMVDKGVCYNPDSEAFCGEVTDDYSCTYWIDREEAEKKDKDGKQNTDKLEG